jgi:hypothetical protein
MGSDRYQVNLYYHGRLEQQFTGQVLNRLLAKLHHCVERFSSGAVGTIVDIEAQKIVHSCGYSTAE